MVRSAVFGSRIFRTIVEYVSRIYMYTDFFTNSKIDRVKSERFID